MFTMILYKIITNKTNDIITRPRNFLILNKFLNGDKITKIKPAKLLIKKRGKRETLFQKSFIVKIVSINFIIMIIYKFYITYKILDFVNNSIILWLIYDRILFSKVV